MDPHKVQAIEFLELFFNLDPPGFLHLEEQDQGS